MRAVQTGVYLTLALAMASPIAWAADAKGCAGVTPEETWSNASAAFAAEDLTILASCLSPEARIPLAFRTLSMSGQLLQMMSLTTEEEGSEAHRIAEAEANEVVQRFTEVQRRHGLPVTAEEAAAIDAEARQEILAAIDYPEMIADLILFIESLEDEDAELGRSSYFSLGDFDTDLTEVVVDDDRAGGSAAGDVQLVRIDGLWYLLPPD